MAISTKPRGNQFQKGISGNPAGRPRGSRHKVAALAEKLLAQDATAIVKVVTTAAKAGDLTAARIVLDRLLPPAKERPLSIELPDLTNIENIGAAHAAVVAAVAAGDILPGEGQALAALLEGRLRVAEVEDLELRLRALEARG
ncbi:DUF5681 domain-containing protein [Thiomonas sp.]|uniref:DUF5681 domain-containing protein n=1 Tax=Thiomonas sp. TaxID=2047785 RepID=UPI002587AC28|nr:DUF5681 domain-containing protein [Thiomonas sp.]